MEEMITNMIREKKSRPIVKIAVAVIILSILVTSTLSFFYRFNGDSYDFTNDEILFVPSGSMDAGPTDYEISTIPKDSIVMVHHLSDEEKADLKSGDVITFYQDGVHKVHRIILIYGDEIITKGDANPVTDPTITPDDVEGKVVGVSPMVGKVVSMARSVVSNLGWLLLIAAVIIIIMLFAIREVYIILKEEEPL